MSLVAGDDVCQQCPVGFLADTHRAGVLHVDRRRLDVTLGDEVDDRGNQRIAQFPGDRLGHRLQHDPVLVGDQVGAVLFDAAGGDDHGVGAGSHGVADFHPGHLRDEHLLGCINRSLAIGVGRDGAGLGGGQCGDQGDGSDKQVADHHGVLVGCVVGGMGLSGNITGDASWPMVACFRPGYAVPCCPWLPCTFSFAFSALSKRIRSDQDEIN